MPIDLRISQQQAGWSQRLNNHNEQEPGGPAHCGSRPCRAPLAGEPERVGPTLAEFSS